MPYLLYDEQGAEQVMLHEEDGNLMSDGNLYTGFYFDNTISKYIDFPAYPAIDFEYNEPFSLNVIFSIKQATGSSVVILDKREFNAGPSMTAEGYGFGYFGAQPYFVLGGNATLGATRQFDYFFLNYNLALNRRYNILITKDAQYNTPLAYRGYVDGEPVNVINFSSFPFTQSIKQNLPLRIGATQGTDPHSNLNGYVYKVALYNATLNEDDALHSFYNEGDTPPARVASRVMYAPFREKAGTNVENVDGPDGVCIGFNAGTELSLGATNRRVDPYSLLPITI